MMSVLMVAYACNPLRGSEPGNGWGWAVSVANAGARVTLITTTDNQAAITPNLPVPGLSVIFVPRPRKARFWSVLPRPVHTYRDYVVWMRAALGEARALNQRADFDLVHHTTWGGLFFGTEMRHLSLPLVFGPVGGAQVIPHQLRPVLGPQQRAKEAIRAFAYKHLLRFSGGARTLSAAEIVICSNEPVRRVALANSAKSTHLLLPDALHPARLPADAAAELDGADDSVHVAWLGRALPIKGLGLAVEAFLLAEEQDPRLRLHVIGSGPDIHSARQIVERRHRGSKVEFHGAVPWARAQEILGGCQLLLFSSLRDTFGAQVLEAMSLGVPVVALSHHGIGDHCPDDALVKVSTFITANDAREKLSRGIQVLSASDEVRKDLGRRGRTWAESHTWEHHAAEMMDIYRTVVESQKC